MHEAKTHLSKLVDAALRSEEISIARRHKPSEKLQVLEDPQPRRRVGSIPDLVIQMGDYLNDSMEDWDEGWPTPET